MQNCIEAIIKVKFNVLESSEIFCLNICKQSKVSVNFCKQIAVTLYFVSHNVIHIKILS